MEQEIFVHAYEVVRPIVLKASRQYFIQLWDQADMEQEAMMTLYQLLEKFPELSLMMISYGVILKRNLGIDLMMRLEGRSL